ncbi:MAG: glycosyltransferase family 4 protein [Cyclobacteriaceae bacterium]
MRIGIINQHIFDILGGSEVQCDIIARHLGNKGHEVYYFAVKGRKVHYDTQYKVIPIPDLKPLPLYQLLKEKKIDVVYWRYNKKSLFVTAFISKLAGSKFIYSISSIPDTRLLINSGESRNQNMTFRLVIDTGILKSIFRKIYRSFKSASNYIAVPLFADGIISNNSDHLNHMDLKNFCRGKKVVIRNSVELLDGKFEWPAPFVIWIASLKSKKNPEIFLKLAKACRFKNIDFLMIGAIQDTKYDYFSHMKDLENFHYLGLRSLHVVFSMLNNALFLVHTCDPEGFPNNLIQAWSSGKPTISLFYDPEGLIEKEELGFYSRSFDKLVSDTEDLIKDETLRENMGNKAREFSMIQFDPEKNVQKLERFFQTI